MEKETLKEAAENYNDKFQENGGSKPPHIKNTHIMNNFIAGAKWQAKRMYSEEDMAEAFIAGGNSQIEEDDCYGTEYNTYMEDWFKKFKKK